MSKANIICTINTLGAIVSKHMPDVLVAVGLIAGAATVVSAVKQSENMPEILDEARSEIDEIKEAARYDENIKTGKPIAKVYFKTGLKVAKNYAKPMCYGLISVTSILYSHNLLKRRNVEALAAASSYEKVFNTFYKRVAEKYGIEEAQKLRYGLQDTEETVTYTDEEGNEVTKKVFSFDTRTDTVSDYSRVFDELNPNWSRYPGDNVLFLKRVQRFANEKLARQGHLFLNELYDLGGWERTKAGNVVGWTKDGENSGGRVLFSCFDIANLKPTDMAFINGYESRVFIDFNTDGVIIDKIGLANV